MTPRRGPARARRPRSSGWARASSRGAVEGSAAIDVDGSNPSAEAPSDEMVRRQLADLERENKRVEALLHRNQGPAIGTGRLIWPVRGAVTSPFGQRWGRLHAGIDISASSGTPVRAADTGRVVVRGPVGGYGNYSCIQHTRTLTSCYAHLSAFG
jgi:murein DD-endopeptidase MepM/ murein hydrolase activator NlpD